MTENNIKMTEAQALKHLAKSAELLQLAEDQQYSELSTLAYALLSLHTEKGVGPFSNVSLSLLETFRQFATVETISALTELVAAGYDFDELNEHFLEGVHDDHRKARRMVDGRQKNIEFARQEKLSNDERYPDDVTDSVPLELTQEDYDDADSPALFLNKELARIEFENAAIIDAPAKDVREVDVLGPIITTSGNGARELNLRVRSPFELRESGVAPSVEYSVRIIYQQAVPREIQAKYNRKPFETAVGGGTAGLDWKGTSMAEPMMLSAVVYQMVGEVFNVVVTAKNQQTGEVKRTVLSSSEVKTYN